jgi:hypothetical protein
MYQFKTEPMPRDRNKAVGDPSIRYRVLMLLVPGSFIDWSKAQIMGTDLTEQSALDLEDRLETQANNT